MPSFTGKTFSNFYKNIFGINQSSNTGVDATTRAVQDGAGNNTSISLSDDVLSVQPNTDNTTGTMLVKNKSGSNIFSVDTTNSKLLGGASQTALNTQYAHFGVGSVDATWAGSLADTHYAVPFANLASTAASSAIANLAMGSSTSSSFNDTNPATSLTIASTAMDMVATYWYVIDNITIDSVIWLHAADTATGESTAAHLMAYDFNASGSSTGGDLSNGVVAADGSNITNAGYEQIYYQSMTVQSADVDAGSVILFIFASDTVNSDYTINATVKYHIR